MSTSGKPRMCTKSGYCSLGHVKPWVGDIAPPGEAHQCTHAHTHTHMAARHHHHPKGNTDAAALANTERACRQICWVLGVAWPAGCWVWPGLMGAGCGLA